uniref:MATH domain-containing protein n=1 Tax=Acrobeloides nanus TaxID=290746 RepID=A0A914CDD0_9BILA
MSGVSFPDCKFAPLGCDVKQPYHEDKRPIKHLTILNDQLRVIQRAFEKLTDDENEQAKKFNSYKISVNGLRSIELPQLIWKIENWNEKFRMAKTRLEQWLTSPSFHSEPFGYRFKALLAPYGFERTYGQCASVFLQIIEGPYDGILRWPFNRKATFMLYDQHHHILQRKNYCYEMSPNIIPENDAFLNRPTSKMPNLPFGCPLFAPISSLVENSTYVLNDTIWIGVSIESN